MFMLWSDMDYTVTAYLRVSTEEQLQNNGITQQMASINAFATTSGQSITHWATEAKSGTSQDRPVIQNLLQRAKDGALKTLIVDRIDRLGRRQTVSEGLFEAFEDAGVEIIVVDLRLDKTPQGVFVRQVFGALAQMQRTEWLNRMKVCRQEAVRNKGTFKGGEPPLGYRISESGHLAVCPRTAPMIRYCFALRAAGLTLRRICAELSVQGFRTRKNTDYLPAQIGRVLRSEAAYRSQVVFGNTPSAVQPSHPPLLE
jgi:site-specific DNA recombinase